jgi:glycosyltransferase involved in cell wall biosynthesis
MNAAQTRMALFSLSCLILCLALVKHRRSVEAKDAVSLTPPPSIWNRTASMLMVKNEAALIRRVIPSLQTHVGRYVFLCDTGSTDDTAALALEATLPDADTIVHKLSEGFKHFEQARNACREAMSRHGLDDDIDWVALPDADFEAQSIANATELPDYDVNTVQMRASRSGMPHNSLPLLIRAPIYFARCRYRLWTHEFLDCGPNATRGYYNGFHFIDHEDGSSRSSKLSRDIGLLRSWLVAVNETELRPRALYYLARAYEDNRQFGMALHTYRLHDAEQRHTNYIFYSRYRVALISLHQWTISCNANASRCAPGLPAVEAALLSAYRTYDGYFRREPLYYLALTHRRLGHYHECLLWAASALHLPPVDHTRIPLMLELELYGPALQEEYDFCVEKLRTK